MLVIDDASNYIYAKFIWLWYSKNILSIQLLSYITYFLQFLNIVYSSF